MRTNIAQILKNIGIGWLVLVRLPAGVRPAHDDLQSLCAVGRRGVWERLFRELAGRGRSANTQMIDSHARQGAPLGIGAEKGGAETGGWPLAWRAQHEDPRNRRC